MAQSASQRICVDRDAIQHLRHDGMGWGHDLDCGCFHVAASPPRKGRVRTYFQRLARRIGG